MITVGGRSLSKVAGAVMHRNHYIALWGMLKTYPDLLDSFSRYAFSSGHYPAQIKIATPLGTIAPTLYSWHDMLTVNEIFCRGDYAAPTGTGVVVDFGSNIGLSALYFLTRNRQCKVYLWEPLNKNLERLQRNCQEYQGRYELTPCAVGLKNGMVNFGYESTGRYGGIDLTLEDSIQVECRDGREVIDGILAKHDCIDILKIDVEGLESDLVRYLTAKQLKRIKRIYAECHRFDGELVGFSKRQYGTVVQFVSQTSFNGSR